MWQTHFDESTGLLVTIKSKSKKKSIYQRSCNNHFYSEL